MRWRAFVEVMAVLVGFNLLGLLLGLALQSCGP
jgi:hypothetical protein